MHSFGNNTINSTYCPEFHFKSSRIQQLAIPLLSYFPHPFSCQGYLFLLAISSIQIVGSLLPPIKTGRSAKDGGNLFAGIAMRF
ncbi:hypothetical protein BMS3Bbin14_02127 [bacterium BMS3Bbin14]|nr:hypothetical protein BMS3Abin13_00082 [bacterium BMS3Abin13]GBE53627.1 hypothetical protein BMS3Bbin14_02127 [bacterium BMS3Bbin14]